MRFAQNPVLWFLSVHNCRLSSFDPAAFPFLRTIQIYENEFTQLPANIGGLTHIEKLDLDRNFVSSLPASISQLHRMNFLSMAHNSFTHFPPMLAPMFANGTLRVVLGTGNPWQQTCALCLPSCSYSSLSLSWLGVVVAVLRR